MATEEPFLDSVMVTLVMLCPVLLLNSSPIVQPSIKYCPTTMATSSTTVSIRFTVPTSWKYMEHF